MNFRTPRNAAFAAIALCFAAGSVVAAPPAQDVPAKHWAKPSVDRVTSKGLMSTDNGDFHGNKYVTRYELAVTLDRLVRYIEAGKKPLHPTKRPGVAAVPKTAPKEARVAIQHLVSEGFLPANSPIVTGDGNQKVTAKQLADAMSQVTIRLSDRSLPPQAD